MNEDDRHLRAVPESGEATDPAADLPAVDGRVPGRRGQATRRRLLDCTRDLLGRASYRDVKVVDIARKAGTSPATFYQYFPDVEAAILVLAEEVATSTRHLTSLVQGEWQGKPGVETARHLVQGFMRHWEEHRPVLRVVELATEEGDLRFRNLRVRSLNEVTRALSEVVAEFQRGGRLPSDTDPMATAGALVAMLAHTASHRYGFEFWGIRTEDLERSLTRIVFWTVTGQKP